MARYKFLISDNTSLDLEREAQEGNPEVSSWEFELPDNVPREMAALIGRGYAFSEGYVVEGSISILLKVCERKRFQEEKPNG